MHKTDRLKDETIARRINKLLLMPMGRFDEAETSSVVGSFKDMRACRSADQFFDFEYF
jgi:hypothetical protein